MRQYIFFLYFMLYLGLIGFSIPTSLSPDSLSQPSYKVGMSKTDISAFVKGVGMLGYSMAFNTLETIETPLYARAFVIEDTAQNKAAIVVCELGFITQELKQSILNYLNLHIPAHGFTDENVMITAQHTHCGPGGFSHYPIYNMSIPGFVPEIFNQLTEQIALAIAQADKQKTSCNIHLNQGNFPDEWEVAFNRSLTAYNRNKDVSPLRVEQKNLAVNRQMVLMKFEDSQHKPLGSINWFGVHATNISNDKHAMNGDNKGYAAAYLETALHGQNPHYIGAFAQGTAGDVTPKYIFNKHHKAQRGFWEGKFPDDIESAKYNGTLQFKQAKSLIDAPNATGVSYGKIRTALRYFDFSDIKIDTCYSHTPDIHTTSPSCISMTMLGGALMDGPAATKTAVWLGKLGARIVKAYELSKAKRRNDAWAISIRKKYAAQGKKDIVLETGEKKMLGTKNVKNVIIPGFADETIRTFKHFHRIGALEEHPWAPQILPLQLIQIGEVVLAGIPFEITTTAGNRLKKSLEELYIKEGVTTVILCPYANAYSGYLTTHEEYQEQLYEGGHTVFGEYSLAALQTVFRDFYKAKEISFTSLSTTVKPLVFTEASLQKRLFYKRKSYLKWEKKMKKNTRNHTKAQTH